MKRGQEMQGYKVFEILRQSPENVEEKDKLGLL
jgi:hypothetical protein